MMAIDRASRLDTDSTSFISQREVRGSHEEIESVARAALREDPDVIVIESMRTAPLINVSTNAGTNCTTPTNPKLNAEWEML